jgi:maltose O-acetyltransferase
MTRASTSRDDAWPALRRARAAWDKHRETGLGPTALGRKGARYLLELGLAPWYLRGVTQLEPGVRTVGKPRIDNQGWMAIGRGTVLRSVNVPVELATGPRGRLTIGRDVSINYGVSIGCLGQVDIGDRCRLGPYVMLVDSDFHDLYNRDVRPAPRPVRLGEDVWVGAKACILPGVTIGRGAVVGTAAVVLRDVAPFTVVAGVPARVIRVLTPELFVTAAASPQPTERPR